MARTFKQLQDNVLAWMADGADTGLMLALVKQSLDKVHRQLLTSEQLDFMLNPREFTITVVSNQKQYPLPDDFLQSLYVYDNVRKDYLQDVPPKQWMEANDGVPTDGDLTNFSITAVQGIKTQPAAAGVVVITPSGGSEATANGIVVQGLDASGNWLEETLTGTTWSSLTTTNSFQHVTAIIKTGATWTRTIVVTVGSTTLLTLTAAQFVKQYQLLEFENTPTQAGSLTLRYYRKPLDLVYDYQLPDIPERFTDLLEYRALLMLTGFTRATSDELAMFNQEASRLDLQLKETYQQARSLGARNRRITMVPRI